MELFLSSGDVLPLFDLHFNREVLLLQKKKGIESSHPSVGGSFYRLQIHIYHVP